MVTGSLFGSSVNVFLYILREGISLVGGLFG